MPVAIAMPKLGMTMQEGIVVEWRAPLGGQVAKGEVLLVIESEKAEVEIEAPAAGVLRHIYVEPGTTVPCGTLLAALTASAEESFDVDGFRREADTPARPSAATPRAVSSAQTPVTRTTPPAAAPVTPAARRRAHDLGIDPAKIPGSGPAGRVTREDVDAYASVLTARIKVADDVSLEVPAQGDGPPLLLIPGFGTDVSAFARQIPALAAQHRVLAVNPRGIGFSDAPAGASYDVATAATDVAAVIATTGHSNAHIVGASLGAATALELALSRPECVRSLVLVTPFVRAEARLLAVIDAWCRLAAEAGPETLARGLVPWLFSQKFLADDTRRERAVRALAQTANRVPPTTLERYAAGLRSWSGTRADDLARVRAPTLVIAAAEDLLTPSADEIAAAIPGTRLVVVPEAGHAVGLEAPDVVNDAIRQHVTI